MEPVTINWWAVIVSAFAYMIVYAIWYAPGLFGNAWLTGIGKTKEQVKAGSPAANYFWGLILAFIASYGIARICVWAQCRGFWDGVVVGLLTSICFVLTTMGVSDIFERRPFGLAVINILFNIIGFIVIGIIIGIWQ